MVDYTIQVASSTIHVYHVRGRPAVSWPRERRTNELFHHPTINAHLHQQIPVRWSESWLKLAEKHCSG